MELCQAQTSAGNERGEELVSATKTDSLQSSYDGFRVVMVLRPAIQALVNLAERSENEAEETYVTWTRARVLVAPPIPTDDISTPLTALGPAPAVILPTPVLTGPPELLPKTSFKARLKGPSKTSPVIDESQTLMFGVSSLDL